jgi:hypothetical protein
LLGIIVDEDKMQGQRPVGSILWGEEFSMPDIRSPYISSSQHFYHCMYMGIYLNPFPIFTLADAATEAFILIYLI